MHCFHLDFTFGPQFWEGPIALVCDTLWIALLPGGPLQELKSLADTYIWYYFDATCLVHSSTSMNCMRCSLFTHTRSLMPGSPKITAYPLCQVPQDHSLSPMPGSPRINSWFPFDSLIWHKFQFISWWRENSFWLQSFCT